MAQISVIERLVVYMLAIFWGFFVLFAAFIDLIRHGPTKLFTSLKVEKQPECLTDTSQWTHNFLKLKEVTIHYVAAGPEDKPLMLFLHGFPEFWYSWRAQLVEFSKDFRVVAIDMRGYGESSKPTKISDYSMVKLTSDVKDVIEGLGYEKCILVAHDWGGVVAWRTAMMYEDKIEKLITMNIPHPAVFAEYLRSNIKQFLKSWYIFLFQLPYLPEWNCLRSNGAVIKGIYKSKRMGLKLREMPKEDLDAYLYTFSQPGALTPPINYYRSALTERPSGGLKISITVPTLMIWGDQDGALETAFGELSGDYCDNYTLKIINGSSHWVQQDAPELVNQCMREFVSL